MFWRKRRDTARLALSTADDGFICISLDDRTFLLMDWMDAVKVGLCMIHMSQMAAAEIGVSPEVWDRVFKEKHEETMEEEEG